MRTRRSTILAGIVVLIGMTLRTQAMAEDADPPPPYTGGIITESSTFTGDWRGARNDLAAKGITLDATVTQVGQGVVGGGKNGAWEYGGRGDLTGSLDTQKLGLWPGGFLTVELEGDWGAGVNGKTGALSPANTNQLFPLPIGDDVGLPALNFAQFLSPYFGLAIGKFATITTTSGDMNAFAHGKGTEQFLNLSFNFNPVILTTIPYSPLAGGVIVLPTKDLNQAIVQFLVMQANGKATTSGFDDLSSDNLSFVAEGRVRTGFFELTGHQLVGATYSNRQFTQLDQRLGFVIDNQALAKKDGSWCVYYNFDQYLYETEKGSDRGVGLFGRFGASDGNPNPVHYFFSAGVGGKGLVPTRSLDQFGLGYYYINVTSPTLQHPLSTKSFLRDEWGFEAYYNLAITPWMLLTPDIQVIGPSQKQQFNGLFSRQNIETATVLGVRMQLIF
jgi:porin